MSNLNIVKKERRDAAKEIMEKMNNGLEIKVGSMNPILEKKLNYRGIKVKEQEFGFGYTLTRSVN